jgi:hypothetical protein
MKKDETADTAWTDLAALAPLLDVASERAEVRPRAQAAQAKAVAALDPVVLAWAKAPDAATIRSTKGYWSLPMFLAASVRATPAFRARLTDPDWRVRLAAAEIVRRLERADEAALTRIVADLWTGVRVPADVDPNAGAKLERLLAQIEAPPSFFFHDMANELESLAHAGPTAAPALGALRACLTIPEKKLQAIDAHQLVAAAIALVGRDRAMLPRLRKSYDSFFADSTMAFPGAHGELVAQAILTLDPEDAKARRALGIEGGPLLDVVTRRVLGGARWEWWVGILLMQEREGAAAGAGRQR